MVGMVTVYHFKVWDQMAGAFIVPRRKSPAERIAAIGGVIIDGTAEDVPETSLDRERRYSPGEVEPE